MDEESKKIEEFLELTDEELEDIDYPQFIFSTIQTNFDDGFWESTLDSDPSMKLYLSVLKSSKFKRINKYFQACNLYDEYIEKFYADNGGKDFAITLLNVGLIKPDFKKPKLNTKSREVKTYLETGCIDTVDPDIGDYFANLANEMTIDDNREIIDATFNMAKNDKKAIKAFERRNVMMLRRAGISGYGSRSMNIARKGLSITDRMYRFVDAPASYSLEDFYAEMRRYDANGHVMNDDSLDLTKLIKKYKQRDKHTDEWDFSRDELSPIVCDETNTPRHRADYERKELLKLIAKTGISVTKKTSGLSKEEIKFIEKYTPALKSDDLPPWENDDNMSEKQKKKSRKKMKKIEKARRLDRERRIASDSALQSIIGGNYGALLDDMDYEEDD